MNRVLRHLRRAALLSAGEGMSDAQLLEAFLSRRDGAAFAALLRRHGPMVLGVCRRVLRNSHDAEDAFQATFLVLARKAGSVRSREVLAGWLYGVAYRTSTKARAMNAKRRTREREAAVAARPVAPPDGELDELLERLDAELHRLPEKYRVPVVLCELEGRSRREAARVLGLAEGTLSWRLAQARKMLARKLSRHGAALPAGAVMAALSSGAASARPSPSLLTATARYAVSAGPVPAKVLALSEGVMKAMFLSKLRVAGWAVVLASVGVGAVGLTYRASAQQPKRPAPETTEFVAQSKVRPAPDDLESLRLEIEALRKELRATQGRVKALEAKAQVQGGGANPYGYGAPAPKGPAKAVNEEKPKGPFWAKRPPQDFDEKAATDAMADFDEAVRRLRKDPTDQDAARALDRALQRLQGPSKKGKETYKREKEDFKPKPRAKDKE
jgi:RNA polymerase sigma factor (sigma-70 family)